MLPSSERVNVQLVAVKEYLSGETLQLLRASEVQRCGVEGDGKKSLDVNWHVVRRPLICVNVS